MRLPSAMSGPAVLVLLLSLILLSAPSSAQVTSVSPPQVVARPGEQVTYEFHVTNNRALAETVSATTDLDWTFQFSSNNFQLLVGGSQQVLLTVSVPPDSSGAVKTFRVSFSETSSLGSQASDFSLQISAIGESGIANASEALWGPLAEAGLRPAVETLAAAGVVAWALGVAVVSAAGSAFAKRRKEPVGQSPGRNVRYLLFVNYFARTGASFLGAYLPVLVVLVVVFPPAWLVQDLLAFLAAGILLCAFTAGPWALLYARTYNYSIQDRELVIRRNIFYRRITIIPYSRIQDLSIRNSPLSRLFGLSYVDVETAGKTANYYARSSITENIMGTSAEGVIIGVEDPEGVVASIKERMERAGARAGT